VAGHHAVATSSASTTEARTVPFDDGRGPNNRKRIKNAREEAMKTNEHQPVDGTKGLLIGGCVYR